MDLSHTGSLATALTATITSSIATSNVTQRPELPAAGDSTVGICDVHPRRPQPAAPLPGAGLPLPRRGLQYAHHLAHTDRCGPRLQCIDPLRRIALSINLPYTYSNQ